MNEKIRLFDGEQETEFEILNTFGVDEKDYAALYQEDEQLIYLAEIRHEDDHISFRTIEDEKELKEIKKIYEELLEDGDSDRD